MKNLLLPVVAGAALSAALPALSADITYGTILAFDRQARTLVLVDRTAWSMSELQSPLPNGLKAGDRVEIRYQADEDGISSIDSIKLMPPKADVEGAPDRVEGTILAIDLYAESLVLTDRSIWSLEKMKGVMPQGLKAGERVEIVYESDEDGVSSISSIRILQQQE